MCFREENKCKNTSYTNNFIIYALCTNHVVLDSDRVLLQLFCVTLHLIMNHRENARKIYD